MRRKRRSRSSSPAILGRHDPQFRQIGLQLLDLALQIPSRTPGRMDPRVQLRSFPRAAHPEKLQLALRLVSLQLRRGHLVLLRFRGDEIDLATGLARVLGAPVDLVMFHRADPVLKFHAPVPGRLLYGNAREFERARLSAVKAWQDCRKIDEARNASLERHR